MGKSSSNEPKLVWEKMSYACYVARGLGGSDLQVVRTGYVAGGNLGWRPKVFGNHFAFARSFGTWTEAALAAERCAAVYARCALVRLKRR